MYGRFEGALLAVAVPRHLGYTALRVCGACGAVGSRALAELLKGTELFCDGKVALVTGAADGGLGRSIALTLAERWRNDR